MAISFDPDVAAPKDARDGTRAEAKAATPQPIAEPIIVEPSIVEPITVEPTPIDLWAAHKAADENFNLEAHLARQPIRDQIAANKVAAAKAPLPAGVSNLPGQGPRNAKGLAYVPDAERDDRPFTVRRLEQVARDAAEGDDTLARMKEGCPPGYHRTFDHLIRRISDGALHPTLNPIQAHDPMLNNPTELTSGSAPIEQRAMAMTPQEIIEATNDADMLALRAVDKADQRARARAALSAVAPIAATQPPPITVAASHAGENDHPNRDATPDRPLSLHELLEPLARH